MLGKRQQASNLVEGSTCDHDNAAPSPEPNLSPSHGPSGTMETAELPPSEVGLLLLEVYFKRVYNASLLFHKPIAFQLYRQNAIPSYLLRAIFAQAAVFLQQVDFPYTQFIETPSIQTIFEKSWSWASSASQEVLSHIDEPTLVRVQALQVLQLYYFSRGLIQRAIIHGSLAYQLCQVLGYARLHRDISYTSMSRSMQLDHEMKRRCFWASWVSLSMGGYKSDCCKTLEELNGLPLPQNFEKAGSVQGIELRLSQKVEGNWKANISPVSPNHCLVFSKPSCSLMAELIKLLDVWYVHLFQAYSNKETGLLKTNDIHIGLTSRHSFSSSRNS